MFGNSAAWTNVSGITFAGLKSTASCQTVTRSNSFYGNLWKGCIVWHADGAHTNLNPHYPTNSVTNSVTSAINASVLSEWDTELPALYSGSPTLKWLWLFWKLSQLSWCEMCPQLHNAWRNCSLHIMLFSDMTPYCMARIYIHCPWRWWLRAPVKCC